jgi:pimeloyl-ACP methyl ester carboxylesterase
MNVHLAVELARRSYKNPDEDGAPVGMTFVDTGSSTGTQAYYGDGIVVFRGTEIYSLKDIKTDVRFLPVRWNDIKVPRGGAAAVNDVLDSLPDDLHTFIGHSLGGELALMTAWHYANEGREIREIITFGAPRAVCGKASVRKIRRKLNGTQKRYVNGNDPVPDLPPWTMGYRHTSMPIMLGTRQNLFLRIFNDIRTRGKSLLPRISDHGIEQYEKQLFISDTQ